MSVRRGVLAAIAARRARRRSGRCRRPPRPPPPARGRGPAALPGRPRGALRPDPRAAAPHRPGRPAAHGALPRLSAPRPRAARGRADRRRRGRAGLRLDRLRRELPLPARPARPRPRPDPRRQPRHGPLGRDRLQAPAGRQGRLHAQRRALRAAARRRGRRLRHRRRRRRPRRDPRPARDPRRERLRRLLRHVLRAGLRRPPSRRGCAPSCSTPRSRVDGFDAWGRATTDAIRAAWTLLCARSDCPGGDPLAALRRLAVRLERTPLTGRARDADGAAQRVRLDGAAFAQLVNDAGYGYPIYRDLLAAGRAYDAGDPAPLLRLAAEDLTSVDAGAPASYSEGAYAAVACHDYPTIWNPASSLAARRAELRAARAQLAPDAFAPFPADLWLDSLYEHQLVFGCLRVAGAGRARPAGARRRDLPRGPVLVLNGDLDVITPLVDAARATALFPNATHGHRRATRST